MKTVDEYRVLARNTATASSNKIHDDAVARRYGFAGGLVPGVDVYAYMTHPPAEAWGLDWLERGSMRARFLTPVYEGEEVVVVTDKVPASLQAGSACPLELRGPDGAVRASGEAQLPEDTPPPTAGGDWRRSSKPTTRPRRPPPAWPPARRSASPRTASTPTTPPSTSPRSARACRSTPTTGSPIPAGCCATPTGCCPPTCGWGPGSTSSPWRSTTASSTTATSSTRRATVTREWERKGHRFVELDVGLLAGGDRLVAHVVHTAIYRPRPKAG